EPQADEVHARQPDRTEQLLRVDGLVADRDPMLVYTVLEAPEPVRLRADHRGGLGRVGNLHVLTADARPGAVRAPRELHDALALARRAVAVLGEQRDAVLRDRSERDQGVTHARKISGSRRPVREPACALPLR